MLINDSEKINKWADKNIFLNKFILSKPLA